MKHRIVCISIWYNREDLVDVSIGSVVNQLTDDDLLILVDDNSADSTFEKLKKWEAVNVIVKTQQNKGFVHSMSDELKHLNCEFVAVHGAGDISLPKRLHKQAILLKKQPDVVAVGCKIRRQDFSNSEVKTTEHGRPGIHDYRLKICNHNPFTHGEVMFKYDKYLIAGGYRTYFTFAQDRDLWCRMSTLGKFCVLDDVLYERKVGIKNSVSGTSKNALMQRYLSGFAVFCHQFKLNNGYDPLEKYGHHASLMYRGSSDLNNDMVDKYGEFKKANNMDMANIYKIAIENETFSILDRVRKFIKMKLA
ncbi:glycosyltransferase [uncultured Paraglaciecola sp.]|uniref:glycosyltransferase n=1 Tax=uncultured Paraglaciecola sp. TaxID=1765024 RepID=UPI0030DABBC2|tara:strand:- start:63495 stop:64412 length:918 start_codon:yes stop_codon:yes gene_type:complete